MNKQLDRINTKPRSDFTRTPSKKRKYDAFKNQLINNDNCMTEDNAKVLSTAAANAGTHNDIKRRKLNY